MVDCDRIVLGQYFVIGLVLELSNSCLCVFCHEFPKGDIFRFYIFRIKFFDFYFVYVGKLRRKKCLD